MFIAREVRMKFMGVVNVFQIYISFKYIYIYIYI